MKKLPVYSYEIDANGYPTGKLIKKFIMRNPERKGKHCWVAACDSNGNEVFSYCELCGKNSRS